MERNARIWLLGLVVLPLAALSCARENSTLRGSAAREYLEAKPLAADPGLYSCYVIRNRRIEGIVAAVFNPGGGPIKVVRRELVSADKNPGNTVVLNDPSGDSSEPVDPDLLKEIAEESLVPEVFLDPDGVQAAVIYRDPRVSCDVALLEGGMVRVRFGGRSDRGGAIAYSLPVFDTSRMRQRTDSTAKAQAPQPAIRQVGAFTLGETVSWKDGDLIKVGAISEFVDQETCLVNVATGRGTRTESVAVDALTPVNQAGFTNQTEE
ncbi:MAG TPA: hypothetical protein PLI51_06365 [bacterium]|nr:hypothetical protein [bacterium]HPQ66333.1 hypothetical protein [bacterium]